MSNPVSQLEVTLKSHHQSLTRPRLTVFEALQDTEPRTMHEIIEACRPAIDRASVYRTITLFEKLGIVQRLHIGWKYKIELSNAFQHHHHHLSCVSCGLIIPLPEDIIVEDRLIRLATSRGFVAQDHQLEIRGLCKECKQ